MASAAVGEGGQGRSCQASQRSDPSQRRYAVPSGDRVVRFGRWPIQAAFRPECVPSRPRLIQAGSHPGCVPASSVRSRLRAPRESVSHRIRASPESALPRNPSPLAESVPREIRPSRNPSPLEIRPPWNPSPTGSVLRGIRPPRNLSHPYMDRIRVAGWSASGTPGRAARRPRFAAAPGPSSPGADPFVLQARLFSSRSLPGGRRTPR